MTDGSDLVVSGGAGGFGADLDEGDRTVVRLHRSAVDLCEAEADLRRGLSLLQGLDGFFTDPGAALHLEGQVMGVLHELGAVAMNGLWLSEVVGVCIGGYRTAEEAERHGWGALGGLLSLGGLPAWKAFGAAVALTVPPGSRVVFAEPAPDALGDAGAPTPGVLPGGAALAPPGRGAAEVPAGGAGSTPFAGGPPAGSSEVDLLTRFGAALGPAAQPALAMLAGALVGPAALLRAPAPLLAARTTGAGALMGIGTSTDTVVVRRALPPGAATSAPPSGVGEAIRRVGEVSSASGPAGRVRVERTLHADGTYTSVVLIPGVQDWAGGSPVPASADAALRGVAGVPSAYTEAVAKAMEEAGVEPGEAVMLAGHSLGGIVATQLAADPAFRARFDVEAVLTAGSPVGQIDVPSDVHSLHLEHREDLVPSADGLANPDLKTNQVTVTASTPKGFGAHDGDGYAALGDRVDASDDPSLVAYREATAKFFAGPGTTTSEVTEVVARRVGP